MNDRNEAIDAEAKEDQTVEPLGALILKLQDYLGPFDEPETHVYKGYPIDMSVCNESELKTARMLIDDIEIIKLQQKDA